MDIKTILFWVCIVIFALPSLFFGFQKVRQDRTTLRNFRRWGYSKSFMILVGIVEIAASVGLFFSQTRLYSISALTIVLIGAIITHLKAKENKELITPICVLAL